MEIICNKCGKKVSAAETCVCDKCGSLVCKKCAERQFYLCNDCSGQYNGLH